MRDDATTGEDKAWFESLGEPGASKVLDIPSQLTTVVERPRGHRWRRAMPGEDTDQLGWRRLAWVFLAALTVNLALGTAFAVWCVNAGFNQLGHTERSVTSLITQYQSSSQAFAASQAKASQAYLSSEVSLNLSLAAKDRQDARLAQHQIALIAAEEQAQRAEAVLAYAQARLAAAEANAKGKK